MGEQEERQARFEHLYDQASLEVLGYALRRAASPEDAADVVSETFLIAWRRLDEVPTGDEARLWLYGVARRVLANQRRGKLRRDELSSRIAREWRPDLDVDAGVLFDDERRTVLSALVRLRPGDQEILRLAVWEELTPAEIAEVLGVSAVAVRTRLSRSRARLRALVGERDRTRSLTLDAGPDLQEPR